MNPDPR
jgi:MFS family permease